MLPEDHKPRLDAIQLVALLIETFFIGMFYVLLIQTFDSLRSRAKMRRENFFKPMTFCALALLGTITARWIVDISLTFHAFILPDKGHCVQAGKPNPAEVAFFKLSDPNFVVSSTMYTSTTVLGDGFMIYRLWIVWRKKKLIIIPPILLLWGIAITGAVVAYRFDKYDIAVFNNSGPWFIGFYLATFLCNFYSSSFIALKIFLSRRELRKTQTESGHGLVKVAEILVESAALYSCCLFISLATYLVGSNVHFLMVTMTNPMIGVIFCMIVTRTHQPATENAFISDLSFQRSGGRSAGMGTTVPMQPFTIKITTETQMDGKNFDLADPASLDRTPTPSL